MQLLQKPSNPGGRHCAQEVMGALPPVVWYMRRQMRGNRGGLSLPQFRALVRIEHEPTTTITAIAEHLALSLSSTSRLISGLVKRGFLARKATPSDRRQSPVVITAKGRAVLQSAREATCRNLELVFAALGSHEQDVLMQAMQTLRQLFGTVASDAKSNGNGRAGHSKVSNSTKVSRAE
jgi:DNA-binding MarR family transcriptional regulator